MPSTAIETYSEGLREAVSRLNIALPAPGDALGQDEEWVVVEVDGEWKRIRLHDYNEVFEIPGLYEKWIYEVFQCQSPQKIGDLLTRAMRAKGASPADLVTLDLGAGNGCVAEELRERGAGVAGAFVGIDIFEEARMAAERDRPGLYDEFVVADMTDLPREASRTFDRFEFNCLTCVAALGFGDIPPEVFAAAYNRIEDGGWVAFTIKTDFLNEADQSGFSALIRRMLSAGAMELDSRETYVHRISTDGQKLLYDALVGRKRGEISPAWLGA